MELCEVLVYDLQLELCGVSKSFGNRRTFDCITEQVETGECLVVTGPNGSGKSTLLRIIAGILAPSKGAVKLSVDGRVLDDEERRDAIGMVAPEMALYDELTALENLRFFAQVRGVIPSGDHLQEFLDRMGLSGREGDLLGSYSSGMKQRLKYAYALLHRPALLILDEPTANLDASGIDCISSLIEDQKKVGAVALATNDREELAYGDKIIQLGN